MSNILALEASTELCSVSLLTADGSDMLLSNEVRSHSQLLLPYVDQVLEKHSLRLGDMDVLACSHGPGSFTGLRICFSVTQGLAFGAQIPMITECSLMAMAHNYAQSVVVPSGAIAICVLDARMDQVYWAAFEYDEHGFPSVKLKPRLQFYTEAASDIRAQLNLSEGVSQYALGAGIDCLGLKFEENTVVECSAKPMADSIAALAKRSFDLQKAVSPEQAELVYLRDTVTWQKRKRIRG